MITIDLGKIEYFDDDSNQFLYEEGGLVRFEFSLRALYEWESKWRKPFLKGGLTDEELIDFYKMMALDPLDEKFLNQGILKQLSDYISSTDTATTFTNPTGTSNKGNSKGKLHTSEEIYALMVTAGIPLEFENRNLNRLLVILRIIDTKSEKPKTMSREDVLRQNASLNAQRKAQLKTKG